MDKDTDFPAAIKSFKQKMRSANGKLTQTYRELEDEMHACAEAISKDMQSKGNAIPETDITTVSSGTVPADLVEQIHRRGCLIIRNVYPRDQIVSWNDMLGEYIDTNDYYTKAQDKAGLDTYFGDLSSSKPQIFGLYWSKPQVWVRQGENMALAKRFLNRLWDTTGPDGPVFNPDQDFSYADRTRRREPGDKTLGLSPHMDAGSVERWLDPAFQSIYAPIFAGNWRDYQPFTAAGRTGTKEYPSAAVCSMFRTFQGWTAMTQQGPGDGTLSLAPTTTGVAYLLLRALQDDIAEDDLCGAQPGKALGAFPQWHQPLLDCLVSIPVLEPGDTIWWHTDVVHSVADAHNGDEYANVIYVGATPECAKNRAYLAKQAEAFLAGKSAPDFAPEDYEVEFKGRAQLEDLTELGKQQMGLV